MTFNTAPGFEEVIKTVKNKLLIGIGWALFALAAYTYPVYINFGRTFNFGFIGIEVFCITLLWLLNRSVIVPTAVAINKTAVSVDILEDYLIIRTLPIKIVFFIEKPGAEMRFDKYEFSRREVTYPAKRVHNLDHKVWLLTTKEYKAYIITDYFDIAFKEELEKFLYWKDTPVQYSL